MASTRISAGRGSAAPAIWMRAKRQQQIRIVPGRLEGEKQPGALEIAGGDALLRELGAKRHVTGIELGRLDEHVERFVLSALFFERLARALHQGGCSSGVANLERGACPGDLRFDVRLSSRTEAHEDLCRAAFIAAGAALLRQLAAIHLRVSEQPLTNGNLAELAQRVLVVALRLQRLLVEGRGLRQEAFAEEEVGDARELSDSAVRFAGAYVEVAQGVHRVPVARLVLDQAHVFRNGSVELSLAEQLLRLFHGGFAIYRHTR